MARRIVIWFLMIVLATNLTYFLASWFLDPTANYLQLRPPRSPEQIVNVQAWF
jgi:peptide/nickel transport system permease protein